MDQDYEGTPNPLNPKPTPEEPVKNVSEATDLNNDNVTRQQNDNAFESFKPTKRADDTFDSLKPIIQPENPFDTKSETINPIKTTPSRPNFGVTRPLAANKKFVPVKPDYDIKATPIPDEAPNTSIAQPNNSSSPQINTAPKPVVTEVKSTHTLLKKRGLIIGGIIAIFLAIGCGVVAALLIINKPEDPVSMAFQNLLENGYNDNMDISGTVAITINDNSSPFSRIKINLNSQKLGGSFANSTDINLNLKSQNSPEDTTVSISEIYTSKGDLYFRTENMENLTTSLINNPEPITDCQSEEDCATVVPPTNNANHSDETLNTFENKWFKISSDTISQATNGSENSSCLTPLINNLGNNLKNIALVYQQNPFISSSTEGIPISNKNYPVRRIVLNKTKLESFITSINSSKEVTNLASCLGHSNDDLNSDSLISSMSNLPNLYVEVDENHKISRLYFEYEDNDFSILTDLNIAYPNSVTISEPKNFEEYESFIQQLLEGVTKNLSTD